MANMNVTFKMKTPTEARMALMEFNKTMRHLTLGKHFRVGGKRYREEVRKSDRRWNAKMKALARANRQAKSSV